MSSSGSGNPYFSVKEELRRIAEERKFFCEARNWNATDHQKTKQGSKSNTYQEFLTGQGQSRTMSDSSHKSDPQEKTSRYSTTDRNMKSRIPSSNPSDKMVFMSDGENLFQISPADLRCLRYRKGNTVFVANENKVACLSKPDFQCLKYQWQKILKMPKAFDKTQYKKKALTPTRSTPEKISTHSRKLTSSSISENGKQYPGSLLQIPTKRSPSTRRTRIPMITKVSEVKRSDNSLDISTKLTTDTSREMKLPCYENDGSDPKLSSSAPAFLSGRCGDQPSEEWEEEKTNEQVEKIITNLTDELSKLHLNEEEKRNAEIANTETKTATISSDEAVSLASEVGSTNSVYVDAPETVENDISMMKRSKYGKASPEDSNSEVRVTCQRHYTAPNVLCNSVDIENTENVHQPTMNHTFTDWEQRKSSPSSTISTTSFSIVSSKDKAEKGEESPTGDNEQSNSQVHSYKNTLDKIENEKNIVSDENSHAESPDKDNPQSDVMILKRSESQLSVGPSSSVECNFSRASNSTAENISTGSLGSKATKRAMTTDAASDSFESNMTFTMLSKSKISRSGSKIPVATFHKPLTIHFFNERTLKKSRIMLFSERAAQQVSEGFSLSRVHAWEKLAKKSSLLRAPNLRGIMSPPTPSRRSSKRPSSRRSLSEKSVQMHRCKSDLYFPRLRQYGTVTLRSDLILKEKRKVEKFMSEDYLKKFRSYAKGNNNLKSGIVISRTRSYLWQKNAGLYDGLLEPNYALDYFNFFTGKRLVLNAYDYIYYLARMARYKNIDFHDVISRVSTCRPPLSPKKRPQSSP